MIKKKMEPKGSILVLIDFLKSSVILRTHRWLNYILGFLTGAGF